VGVRAIAKRRDLTRTENDRRAASARSAADIRKTNRAEYTEPAFRPRCRSECCDFYGGI